MKRLTSVFLPGLLWLGFSQSGLAALVDVITGSDYFVTQPGTTFMGVAFNGVPNGPGGSDTIVERLANVSLGTGAPASGATPLLMTQLNLISAAPANFGLGVGFYYFTLQSSRDGPATTGNMTINLTSADDLAPLTPEGSFSSFFDVFFDIRSGSLNGVIAQSGDLTLTNSGASWDANPAPSAFLVPGLKGDVTANLHTNKIQNADIHDMDFFPIGVVTQAFRGQGVLVVQTTQNTPEPGTMTLIAGGLLVLLRVRRRSV
jgi:hypothetical protein